MQSDKYANVDQLDHITKMCELFFKSRTLPKLDVPFRSDSQIEDNYESETP